MALIDICKNVAADCGIDEPVVPMFNSRQPASRRLLAQARRALWALRARADWAELVVEHEFQATGSSDYALPADFGKMINDTVWERSRYWAMRGSLGAQQWQLYRSSIYGRATMWRRYRLRIPSGQGAGQPVMFSIDPPVSSTDSTSKFVFEYRSTWCVVGKNGQMQPDWADDYDTSILDEMLLELGTRWRMLRRLGLAYDEEKDEYEREVDKMVARNGGTQTLNLVPAVKRDDFIGQYSLGAFPPTPTPTGTPSDLVAPLPPGPPLPFSEMARLGPFEARDWQPDYGWPDDRPPPLRPIESRAPPRLSPEEIAAAIVAAHPDPGPPEEVPPPWVQFGRPRMPARARGPLPPGT